MTLNFNRDDRLPELPGVTDEHIRASGPAVRKLLLDRLEMIWQTVQPHVDGTRASQEGEYGGPDVRFVEAGIRCLDRLAKLYRLDQPVPVDPLAGDASQDQREIAMRGLDELEQRAQG